MEPDRPSGNNLYLQIAKQLPVVAIGEVLWDIFPEANRLGGAPLNFGVHARRLGHDVSLISAVGQDDFGRQALEKIAALQIDTTFLQQPLGLPTGTAVVEATPEGKTVFNIQRPAAYDAIQLSDGDIDTLHLKSPGWLYYGTLFASTSQGRTTLERLLDTLDEYVKFYDLNLRQDSDSPALVTQLLECADVVKLNEEELHRVHDYTGLPSSPEAFCREASARYGWKAVAVTRGAHGCAILADGRYVEAAGQPAVVADPVGAGDAFAAAFMHGLGSNWPLSEIAAFANRIGALVASRNGAIPDWTMEETAKR